MYICKACGCQITISEDVYWLAISKRTGYYCQQCGEDKKEYEIVEKKDDD